MGVTRPSYFATKELPTMRHAYVWTLLSTVLLFAANARSQGISVTFTAEYNGAHVALDNILVMNLTHGGDTLLHAPDSVLVLDISTAVPEVIPGMAPGLSMRPPIPNPFVGSTLFQVYVEEAGPVLLTVYDALGKVVASADRSVERGMHAFQYVGGPQGVLTAVVNSQGKRAVQKVVCNASVVSAPDLRYTGRAEGAGGGMRPKSGGFTWLPGDSLRYIGYATFGDVDLSAAIDDTPALSTTQVFVLGNGQVCTESPLMMDIDGNTYRTVMIGSQCWMAENLRTAHYRDGTAIPHVPDSTWGDYYSGAWCAYNNDPGNDTLYGKLYNGFAADTNLCPFGWHLPTDTEWQELELFLGVPASEMVGLGWRGEAQNVGGRLKAIPLWGNGNAGATNATGFSALPSGSRDYGNMFLCLHVNTSFWTGTETNVNVLRDRFLHMDYTGIFNSYANKREGHCVRCLRD
jgi:uncharacterized protein (TIGR02145 family)